MKALSVISSFIVLLGCFPLSAQAQESTTVIVRAKARDAKFIGDYTGGALIKIKNASTGELLAKGTTKGTTGSTELITTPKKRYEKISTEGSAKFVAQLQLEKPTFVTVSATRKHTRVTSSTQLWLIPGQDITGDGIILEIPGFAVKILKPNTDEPMTDNIIDIKARVVMMCGCSTKPGGLWDSSEYKIMAVIKKEGETVEKIPMDFSGKSSIYNAFYHTVEPGTYKILVYAFHPKTDNTGLDKTNVTIR